MLYTAWFQRVAHLCVALGAIVNAAPHLQTPLFGDAGPSQLNTSAVVDKTTKPFWAIAHRVLDKSAVDAALMHGANALEIDMQPWDRQRDRGWWACHDRVGGWGDQAEVLFKHIAMRRSQGQNVLFVWLDIKNSDMCEPNHTYSCSVGWLRQLARDILLPSGVRVLYGLYSEEVSEPSHPTYERIVGGGLDPAEAVNIDGDYGVVRLSYEIREKSDGGRTPLPLPQQQRTMAKGLFNMWWKFPSISTELKQGVQSNYFGKVFGWTVLSGDQNKEYANFLMGAGVDGLIYGNMASNYDDSKSTRWAWEWIKQALIDNQHSVHLATRDDPPPW